MEKLENLDALKKIAKSFLDRLPTADSVEKIDNDWKMFVISYLNTNMTPQEIEHDGPILFRVIQREYLETVHNLTTAE